MPEPKAPKEPEPESHAQTPRGDLSSKAWIVTLAALALAALHTFKPDLGIDAVTLGLLGLAAVPFLLPRLKTAEIPGFGKFEFQELQKKVEEGVQRVETAAKKVEAAANFAISGVTEQQRTGIETALQGFAAHLDKLGLEAPRTPKVEVSDTVKDNSYYDGQRETIVVARAFASENDAVFREYGHHVLLQGMSEKTMGALAGFESALADYLFCSYQRDPVVGRVIAASLRKTSGFDKPFVRNLENDRRFTELEDPPESHDAGEIWGGVFWELRATHGTTIDEALVRAWKSGPKSPAAFWKALQKELSTDASLAIVEIAKRRGLEGSPGLKPAR